MEILREKRINGLLFGIIAGLCFSAGAWGLDWALLVHANSDYPWLKFMLGSLLIIIVSGLVGWLTARLDNGIFGSAAWLLAGVIFVWVSSHIPFEGLSFVIGFLDPRFAGMDIYPFVESARFRMKLLFLIIGAIAAFGGGIELMVVEAATRSSSAVRRMLSFFLCLVIFAPMGLIVDNLINLPFRRPIVVTADLIRLGVQAREGFISEETQRKMGVRALTAFGDRIIAPSQLTLGSYDPESFEETTVNVNFSGEWGVCVVMGNRLMNCWLSAERYIEKLDCLIMGGSPEDCSLRIDPAVQAKAVGLFSDRGDDPIKYGIVGQRGRIVLVLAEDSMSNQVECAFRDARSIYLESCAPTERNKVNLAPLLKTPTPEKQPISPTSFSPPEPLTRLFWIGSIAFAVPARDFFLIASLISW